MASKKAHVIELTIDEVDLLNHKLDILEVLVRAAIYMLNEDDTYKSIPNGIIFGFNEFRECFDSILNKPCCPFKAA